MRKPVFAFAVFCTVCTAFIFGSVPPLTAQEGITRIELRRADLTGSETTEVIMSSLKAAPGAVMPRHIHRGDEFLYVIEGGTIQAPGHEPMHLEAGATLHFPREVPHGGFTVIGDATLRVITVHVVDKDRPLTELVE